jgi:hypothetical protein
VARPEIDYLILDAVADDVESFGHIRERIGAKLSQTGQVIASLRRLVRQAFLEAYSVPGERGKLVSAGPGVWPAANAEDIWFRITRRGTIVHQARTSDAEGAA